MRRGKSTAISRRASSVPEPSPLPIMSRWAARPRRARRASCAPRARPMSCRTAMSCTSCIADGYPPACGSGSTGLERRQDRTWPLAARRAGVLQAREGGARLCHLRDFFVEGGNPLAREGADAGPIVAFPQREQVADFIERSEEHTSELQSLMRISYAVFCLKKKKTRYNKKNTTTKH